MSHAEITPPKFDEVHAEALRRMMIMLAHPSDGWEIRCVVIYRSCLVTITMNNSFLSVPSPCMYESDDAGDASRYSKNGIEICVQKADTSNFFMIRSVVLVAVPSPRVHALYTVRTPVRIR